MKTTLSVLALFLACPLFGQHMERALFRPTREAPRLQGLLAGTEQGPDDFYLQAKGSDSKGDVTPDALLGLEHDNKKHPWFAQTSYSREGGSSIAHRNTVGATANYQLWTGPESKDGAQDAPYLEIQGDYSNRFHESRTLSTTLDAGVTRGNASLDAVGSWATEHDRGTKAVSDFIPSLSFGYVVVADRLTLLADYEFRNDVDGAGSFDFGVKASLSDNVKLIAYAAQHGKVSLALRKTFHRFWLTGGKRA